MTAKINANDAKSIAALKAKEAELAKASQEAQTAKAANQTSLAKFNAIAKRVADLEASLKAIQTERDSLKASVEQLRSAESQSGAKNKEEIESLKKNLEAQTAALNKKTEFAEGLRININKLKNLGRNFKVKSETLEKEVAEKAATIAKLEEELKAAKESSSKGAVAAAATPAASDLEEKLSEAESLVEQSAIKITELYEKLEALEADNKKIKDTSKEKEDRAKSVLVALKVKLNESKTENQKLAADLKLLQESGQSGSLASEIKDLRSGLDLL